MRWVPISRRDALQAILSACVAPRLAFAGDPKAKTKKGVGEPIVEGELGKRLDEHLSSAQNYKDGYSGVVLVAKNGKIALQKGYGVANAPNKKPIGPDALFDWCSVTKQWTSAAILRLEMAKKIDIDQPLSKFVKDCPKDKAKVLVRHLMNHTSGITSDGGKEFSQTEANDRDALMRWFLACPVKNEPGTNWEYSNAAYFFLAALIEKLSSKSYEDYVHENVFKPAEMSDTYIIGDPKLPMDRVPLDDRGKGVRFAYGDKLSWGYRGAGGIVASVSDMLLWDRALRGTKVLSDAVKKKYYTVGLNNYACGWEVSNNGGMTEYAHSGHTGKVVTYYQRWIDPDVVVATASNEEPAVHPKITCGNLATMARNA